MRADSPSISAPPFPRNLPWVNVAMLRMDQQRGKPVLVEVWDIYGNEGWPARYLWDPDHNLYSMHYGEGAYVESELEIQALLGVSREPVAPVRPEDAEDALIAPQT